jgi:diadenosine tetraphosphate (Ap4A) HIT family hydrolase
MPVSWVVTMVMRLWSKGPTEPLKAEGHDLTAGEAVDLGPLLSAVSSALRDVAGRRKTYVALFAEAEGFQHIHFHIIPRQPALEADLRGPRVFGLLCA